MELMDLIEPKQLMELVKLIELLESRFFLWIGGYDWIDRADGTSGISGVKEEMTGTDGLVGIDGNFKATGIDRIETV